MQQDQNDNGKEEPWYKTKLQEEHFDSLEYATEVASQPIASLIATKKLMLSGGLSGQSREERVMEAHHREMAAFANGLTGGPANREAIKAFREKRKPDFSRL